MSRSRPALLLDEPDGALAARLRGAGALFARSRRLAAAVCAGASVLAVVSALTPPAPATAAGDPGAAGGFAPVTLPAGAGAGRVADADRVAVTVRLADAAGVLLLRPGIHVEVLGGAPAGSAGASGDPGGALVVAADALVLEVPQPAPEPGDGGSLLGGGPVGGDQGLQGVAVLSVTPADAQSLAAAAGTRPLSVTVALPGA